MLNHKLSPNSPRCKAGCPPNNLLGQKHAIRASGLWMYSAAGSFILRMLGWLILLSCALLACKEPTYSIPNSVEMNASGYLSLRSGNTRLLVALDTGGRIASFQYKKQEILSQTRDKDNFQWGSTIWPAPQAAWQWPPPPKMDQGPYKVIAQSPNQLIIESPKDAYEGIQVRKSFTITKTDQVDILYTFTNHGDKTVPVGIWEISRIPFAGTVRWKTGALQDQPLIGYSSVDTVSQLILQNQTKPGKIFIDSQGGWLQYELQGVLFTKTFDRVDPAAVAPEQAPIEIYFDPPRKFAELEQHAVYIPLKSGASSSFQVRWRVEDLDP